MKKAIWMLALVMMLQRVTAVEYQVRDFDDLKEKMPKMKELFAMHLKLYAGYVNQTNELAKLMDQLRSEKGIMRSFQDRFTYESVKRRFGWEFDGMRLHELYFENLGGKGLSLNRRSNLNNKIKEEFGSTEKWKEDFQNTCMVRGIGWAVLYWDPVKDTLYNTWVQDHDSGPLISAVPIFVIDLWEHAYLTVFGLDRKAYVEYMFQNTDWSIVEKRFNREHRKTRPKVTEDNSYPLK